MIIRTELYAHQKTAGCAALNALQKTGYHALFMEIGTGKTLTALWTALQLGIKRILIIAPKAIVNTWKTQVETHCDGDYIFSAWKSPLTHEKRSAIEYGLKSERPFFFAVNVEAFSVNNEYLKKYVDEMLKSETLIILDESHAIKHPEAQRSKRVAELGKRAQYRLAMTGTEITNSPFDIYNQFRFLKNDFWKQTFYIFKQYYGIMLEHSTRDGRRYFEVIGYRNLPELVEKITPYISRARKADCLDLPETIFEDIRVSLSDKELTIYKKLKRDLMVMIENSLLTLQNKVSLFTKFRQITGGTLIVENESKIIGSAKLSALMEFLESTDEQVIIWAQFDAEIIMIYEAIRERMKAEKRNGGNVGKWTATTFYGKTTNREKAEDDFP